MLYTCLLVTVHARPVKWDGVLPSSMLLLWAKAAVLPRNASPARARVNQFSYTSCQGRPLKIQLPYISFLIVAPAKHFLLLIIFLSTFFFIQVGINKGKKIHAYV